MSTAQSKRAQMKYKIPKYKCRLVRDGYIMTPLEVVEEAEQAATVFMKSLKGLPHEEIHALYMSANNRVLALTVVARGGSSGAGVTAFDVWRGAILANARCLVLAHNHPSGDPKPSADDIAMTRHMQQVGTHLGVPLLDHLVCCPETNRWVSILDVMDKLELSGNES